MYADSGWFSCHRGAGYGGDGGNGGDGGDGGDGGNGGDGGSVTVRYVLSEGGPVAASNFWLHGGAPGAPGSSGWFGLKGQGGKAGSKDFPWCKAEPQRAGSPGTDGSFGESGVPGTGGSAGALEVEVISASEWNHTYTAPYLSEVEEAQRYVGEAFTFLTLNVAGEAEALLVDVVDGSEEVLPLIAVEEDVYELQDTSALSAGVYTVSVIRGDGEEAPETLSIELLPVLSGVEFEDPYDAVPGGTAHLYGQGIREDSELLYEGALLEEFALEQLGDNHQRISFILPVEATHGALFVRDNGETDYQVMLSQPHPLSDSDSVTFHLLKTAGLTFRPSTHGYLFSNGDLTPYAKDEVAADPWQAFCETYGTFEIETAVVTNPFLFPFYAAWKSWWSPDTASANCLGMSSNLLSDFFNGVTGVEDAVEEDVARNVMLAQGHLLSEEFISGFLMDGFLSDLASTGTINEVVSFLHWGADHQGGDAPVLVMVPDLSEMGPELAQILSMDLTKMKEGMNAFVDAIGSSHALAPYMVVYEDKKDAFPSRIYFYDSNMPGDDAVYMELHRTGSTYEWEYDLFYDPADSDPYVYGSSGKWVLADVTVDEVMGDVDVMISLFPY